MMSDVQLAVFVNALGVLLFMLVVWYHYLNFNSVRDRSHLHKRHI